MEEKEEGTSPERVLNQLVEPSPNKRSESVEEREAVESANVNAVKKRKSVVSKSMTSEVSQSTSL